MRQRFYQRSVNSQQWVEEMRQADAVGLGNQTVGGAIAIEAPLAALFDECEPGFVLPVENLLRDAASGGPINHRKRVRAVPLHVHHSNGAIWTNASNRGLRREVLQLHAFFAEAAVAGAGL